MVAAVPKPKTFMSWPSRRVVSSCLASELGTLFAAQVFMMLADSVSSDLVAICPSRFVNVPMPNRTTVNTWPRQQATEYAIRKSVRAVPRVGITCSPPCCACALRALLSSRASDRLSHRIRGIRLHSSIGYTAFHMIRFIYDD